MRSSDVSPLSSIENVPTALSKSVVAKRLLDHAVALVGVVAGALDRVEQHRHRRVPVCGEAVGRLAELAPVVAHEALPAGGQLARVLRDRREVGACAGGAEPPVELRHEQVVGADLQRVRARPRAGRATAAPSCCPRRRRSRRRRAASRAISRGEVPVVLVARIHPLLAHDAQAGRPWPPTRYSSARPSPSSDLSPSTNTRARRRAAGSSAPPPRPARRPRAPRARSCGRPTGRTCRARPPPAPGTSLVSPIAVDAGLTCTNPASFVIGSEIAVAPGVEVADVGDRARVLDGLAGVLGGLVRIPADPVAAGGRVVGGGEVDLEVAHLAARLPQRELLGVDDALRLVGVRALERQAREDRERVARHAAGAALLVTAAGDGHDRDGACDGQQGFGGGANQRGGSDRSGAILAAVGPPTADCRPPTYIPRMKIGVLTAGGDCPGLNAVIRAVTRKSLAAGHEVGRPVARLRRPRGAQLRAARHARRVGDPAARRDDPVDLELRPLPPRRRRRRRCATAVAAGRVRRRRRDRRRAHDEHHAQAARGRAPDDRRARRRSTTTSPAPTSRSASTPRCRSRPTRSTACTRPPQSHDRVMVIEVMGRNTGWIAVFSGIAGGADAIVIPELELTVEEIGDSINARHERGKSFSIVVVAEGAELAFASGEKRQVRASTETDNYGYPRLGGIGQALGARDRGAHRLRDARHDARPRPARRHADGHRPRARHPLRGEGGRACDRRRVRPDGRAARDRDDERSARRRAGGQADRPRLPAVGQHLLRVRLRPGTDLGLQKGILPADQWKRNRSQAPSTCRSASGCASRARCGWPPRYPQYTATAIIAARHPDPDRAARPARRRPDVPQRPRRSARCMRSARSA